MCCLLTGGDYKPALLELNKALSKTLDDFVVATESALKVCSMIVKKVDKKKDRHLIIQHREKLLEQLQQCHEPALILHLTALILFTTITGCILHASGKFVSQILAFITPSLTDEQNKLLSQYHGKIFLFFSFEIMYFKTDFFGLVFIYRFGHKCFAFVG